MSENNEIELISTALQSFDKVSAGLAILEKNYKGVLYDVETSLGMEHARAARAAVREPRYEIERVRKSAKAPLLALGKRLDAEATRITNALLTLETPIDEQIKSEESRKEREKLEKAAAEQRRIDALQARVDAIRSLPVKAGGKSADHARSVLTAAQALVIGEDFAEFAPQARDALTSVLAACQGIVAEREAFEAEQVRIQAEREELARLRAEQTKRDAEERARIAEEARVLKVAADAEAAKQAEALRAEREALAEQQRAQQAERQQAAAAQRIEAERLAAERAAFETEQAEARRQQEEAQRQQAEAARLAAIKKPADTEIIKVLVDHYRVPENKVREWLRAMKLTRSEAA